MSLRAATGVLATAALVAAGAVGVPAYAANDAVEKVSSPADQIGGGGSAPNESDADVPDGDRSEKALDALDLAEDSLQGKGALDPTIALLGVQQNLDDLPADQVDRATRILARPTDPNQPSWAVSYGNKTPESHCTARFCVHWLKSGQHKPDLTDSDDDGVPDYVETVSSVIANVWSTEIGELGYQRPKSDGRKGNPEGVSRKGLVDVYLGDTGASSIYGYASTEQSTRRAAAYLVLDNDYTDFPGKPKELLQVTAAHEFFHAVQFGYASDEDSWLMETTSTWMEEQVYDDINDNRQFLPMSSLRRPGQPLDLPDNWYGNWIFFEWLSGQHGAEVVKDVWTRAASPDVTSIQAINAALKQRGSDLPSELSRFSAVNTMARRSYPEGAAYQNAPVAQTWKLGTARRNTGPGSTKLAHLASRNYTFVPRAGTSGKRWLLRLKVSAPSSNARAYALLHLRNGKVIEQPVTIGGRGKGRRDLRFGHKAVRKVTLTLTNASMRYRCFTGGQFACSGTSKDDRRTFAFRAVLRRR